MSIKLGPPRGMRDFYPDDYRVREALFNAWREEALLYGFEFVDAPVVESLELLERKAGEEISDQLYAFEDKSQRQLALRGEFTPSLARLVLSRKEFLNAPQKWAAIAQCFRYERMSQGRKREHYQWNMDVIGANSTIAEVEIIAAATGALARLGLTAADYAVRVGSRRLIAELYASLELPSNQFTEWSRIIDKQDKMPRDALFGLMREGGFTETDIERTGEIIDINTLEDARSRLGDSPAVVELDGFFANVELAGLNDVVTFDAGIIRGLDYYTGIVFEAFDRAGELRAIFGGGRYEGLLETLGGPRLPCVGLGFGDVVVMELLKARGKTPAAHQALDCCIGYLDEPSLPLAIATSRQLRSAGRSTDLAVTPEKAKAFFRRASRAGAQYAIFIGPEEVSSGEVEAKDMAAGESVPMASLLVD